MEKKWLSLLDIERPKEYPPHEITPDEDFIAARRSKDVPYDTGCENLERYNRDWWLSPTGDMVAGNGYYIISDYQLSQDMWFKHLMLKPWFNANTFIPAYFEACNRAHIDHVNISVQNNEW